MNCITLKDQPIYGSGRAGVLYKSTGLIEYELTDHLGNVRATISRNTSGIIAQSSRTDYYAFGGFLRHYSTGSNYIFNYQGQENAVNSRMDNFELRMLNTDLGRWISPDPAGQFASPYISMGNNPVSGVDPDGGWTSPNYFSSAGFVTSAVVSAMVRVNDGWPTMFDIFCATYFAEEIGFMNSSFLMGGRGHGAGGGYGNGGSGSGEFGNFLDASNNAITMQYELTYTDANGKKSIVSGIFNNRQVAEKYAKIYQDYVNNKYEQQKQQELLAKNAPRGGLGIGELYASNGKGSQKGGSGNSNDNLGTVNNGVFIGGTLSQIAASSTSNDLQNARYVVKGANLLEEAAFMTNLARGIGIGGAVVGTAISGYKITNGSATTIDYFDFGVGAASAASAIFLVSNPIGWGIGIGGTIYFTGRLAYDFYGNVHK